MNQYLSMRIAPFIFWTDLHHGGQRVGVTDDFGNITEVDPTQALYSQYSETDQP